MYRTLVILLLILWGTRIAALEALPLHNDEGLHLTRAIEVWNLHPFWEIRDGKIINHWLIGLFYPQNAPVFVGRIATIFVSLLGLAAGYALALRWFGYYAALLAGVLWIGSTYLFFYERLAFSDAEAGALVVVALWASLRLAHRGRIRDALFTGMALALATLFKFTAAPFAVSVALIVLLLGQYSIRRRVGLLVIVGVVVAACFAAPVAYLLQRGDDLFSIALGWVGVGNGGAASSFGVNIARLTDIYLGFTNIFTMLVVPAGLALFVLSFKVRAWILLAAVGLPLWAILFFGREVMPRHYVVALPALLVLGGAGLGTAANMLRPSARRLLAVVVIVVMASATVFYFSEAYNNPPAMRLPLAIRAEHYTDHSAGYGLREAVQEFPNTIFPADAPIVGSMFPDGCRRANFYAVDDMTMICTDAPGIAQMQSLLAEQEVIYVLTDTSPFIGASMLAVEGQLSVEATRVAAYPRPGESSLTASVVLWRVER